MDDEPSPVRVVYPLDLVRARSDPAFVCCLLGVALGFALGSALVGVLWWAW